LAARYTIVMYTPSQIADVLFVYVGCFVVWALFVGMAGYTIRYGWLRLFGVPTSPEAEDFARQLMGLMNEVDMGPEEFLLKLGGEPEGHRFSVRPGAIRRCAVSTALKVRSVMDCSVASEANRLCVYTLAGKFLKDLNVRECDIARMLPIICMACFLPTEEDLLVAEMADTAAVVRAIRRKETIYTSRDRAVWLERRWGDRAGGLRFTK
jgi:hypothetical protein